MKESTNSFRSHSGSQTHPGDARKRPGTLFEIPGFRPRHAALILVALALAIAVSYSILIAPFALAQEEGTVALSPAQPMVGVELTATLTDPDGAISGATWVWASSTDGSTAWADISGATSASYTPVTGDVGKYLRATVSYTDGHGSGNSAQGVAAAQVNNPPAFASETDGRSIAENSAEGDSVGEAVTATDAGDTLTYSLSGDEAASFAIGASTGQITVGTGASLDYETKASYTVTVTATDTSDATDTITVTINVTNVDEAGTVALSPAQPMVGAALTATLADPDGAISGATWMWASSTDGSTAWADIGSATAASYTPVIGDVGKYLRATVSYTDGEDAGKSAQGVAAAQVNNAPAFASETASRSIAENSAEGDSVGGAVTATDAGDTLTYSLSGDEAASFAIGASTGQITVGTGASLDYETKASYTVTVTATDTSNATDTITVTINVTNVTNVDEAGAVALPPAQPVVGVELTATLTDPDGTISATTWQWAGSSDWDAYTGTGTWTDISGATSARYTPVTGDVGNYLRATVSYTDRHGSGKSAQGVSANKVPPKKPTGLSAAAGPGGGQVSLTWDAATDTNITGYEYSQAAEIVKLTPSDGKAEDEFGWAVAVAGDTMVIGADADGRTINTGAAYVFTRADGEWSEMAKLTASDGSRDDYFGYWVAVDGDTVVVGAYRDDDKGLQSGSVYVFVKPSSGWASATETAKLTASDGERFDLFGRTVSVDGDTIVVGAYLDDDNGPESGSAYVFVRPSTGWASTTQTAKLTASDGARIDRFGHSVAVEGETVVVGANWDDDDGTDSGSAYVFVKPSAGWTDTTETAKLTASDGAKADRFGHSVAVYGDTVAVASDGDDDNGTSSGSVYLFVKPSTGWASATQTAKLTASDATRNDYFGQSVSMEGDAVAVGAYANADDGLESGSAYVFVKPSAGWANTTETAKLTASDAAKADRFGWSISVTGDTVVVGAYKDNDNGRYSGSAYVYQVKPWTPIPGSGATTTSHTVTGLTYFLPYTFQLRAVTAGGASQASGSVKATLPAKGDPAFADDTATLEVVENTDAGENIGAPGTATDPDSGDTLTYSLSEVDASPFAIDTATGRITVGTGTTLDYESKASYTVTVSVSDGKDSHANADTTEDDTITVTINVTNVEEAGTVALSPAQPMVGAALTATLADPDGAISGATWMWASSTDGSTAWADIGSATAASYTPVIGDVGKYLRATVSYTDGEDAGKSAQGVAAAQVNNAPAFASETASRSIAENSAEGDSVGGAVTATDAGDTLTYSLSGDEAASFAIGASTGQITVGTDTSLDYETKASYRVTVMATDTSNATDTITVTINVTNVTNVDEAGAVALSPAQPVVRTALTATLTDPDGTISATTWVWAGSSDWDASIEAGTWNDISGETSASYTPVTGDVGKYLRATVSYTDGEGAGKSAQGVAAAQVNNPPVRRPSSGRDDDDDDDRGVALTPVLPEGVSVIRELEENSVAGAKVGGPRTTTESEGGQFTYSLGGEDAALFSIDPRTGQILLGSGVVLDYESGKRTYTVDVLARTSTGDISKTSVTVAVTNVDEPGTIIVSPDTGLMAGATLTASLTDPDGGVTGEAWRWQRSTDGTTWTDIGGAASASYSLATADAGILLRAAVSYADALGTGLSLAGEALSRVEAAPQPQPTPTPQPMATPEPTLEPSSQSCLESKG